MWKKPHINHKKGAGETNLNRELQRESELLTAEEIKYYAIARVTYEMKLRAGTKSEMSHEEFNKRLEWLIKRNFLVKLRHGS